jgi:hypothetical protein
MLRNFRYNTITNKVMIELIKKNNGVNIVTFKIQFLKDEKVSGFDEVKKILSNKLSSILETTINKDQILFSIILNDSYDYLTKVLHFIFNELLNSNYEFSKKPYGDISIQELVNLTSNFNLDFILSDKKTTVFCVELEKKFEKMKNTFRYRH